MAEYVIDESVDGPQRPLVLDPLQQRGDALPQFVQFVHVYLSVIFTQRWHIHYMP